MKIELTTEDRERIEQEAEKYSSNGMDKFNFRCGAEYATIYEREKQAKALPEALQEARSKLMYIAANAMNEDVQRQANVAWQEITTVALSLEAERSEVRNKVIDECTEIINLSTLNIDWKQQLTAKLDSLKTK